MNKEIEIPEGYKARIEGNKVIIELQESEDERVRAHIVLVVKDWWRKIAEVTDDGKWPTEEEMLAYLEKQKEQKPVARENDFVSKPIEWSDNFEENIRNLLHDKLTRHSKDGSTSSTVFIDDKTLKDIICGIWFYVGKEALKYPNKELNVTEWSEEDEKIWRDILELCNKFGYDDACRLLKSSMKNKGNSSKSNTNSPWKPSEEQMAALYTAARESPIIKEDGNYLYDLYNDLKKL